MPHIEGHIEEPQVQGLDYQAIYQKYYDKGFDIEKATQKMRVLYGAKQPELDALNAFYESKKKVKTVLQPRTPVRRRFLRYLPQVQLLRQGKRMEIRILL